MAVTSGTPTYGDSTTFGTTAVVNLPTVANGEWIHICIAAQPEVATDNPLFDANTNRPASWLLAGTANDTNNSSGDVIHGASFLKQVDGTEGSTVSIPMRASAVYAAIAIPILGAADVAIIDCFGNVLLSTATITQVRNVRTSVDGCLAFGCVMQARSTFGPSSNTPGWVIKDTHHNGGLDSTAALVSIVEKAMPTKGDTGEINLTTASAPKYSHQIAFLPAGTTSPRVKSHTWRIGGGSSWQVELPSERKTGELGIIDAGNDASTNTDTWVVPTGWTKISRAGGTAPDADAMSCSRVFDGTETDFVTVGHGTSTDNWSRCRSFVDAEGIGAVGASYTASSGTTHTIPGLTTTKDNSYVGSTWAFDGADSTRFEITSPDWGLFGYLRKGTSATSASGGQGHIPVPTSGSASGDCVVVASTSDGLAGFQYEIKSDAAGTTPVNNDLDVRWNITGNVGESLDLRWNIIGNVGDDLDLRWDVEPTLTTVFDDLNVRWNVGELVSDDLDARWNMQEFVNNDIDIRYNINELILTDLDLRWMVANTVGDNLDARWTVFEFLANDLDLRWDLAGTIGNDLDLRWNLVSLITVGDDLDIRWNTLNLATGDLDARWNVSALVSDDLDARWNVQAFVNDDLDVRWNIDELVNYDLDIRWMVLNTVNDDLDARWHIEGKTGNDLKVVWDIESLGVDHILPGIDPVNFRIPQPWRAVAKHTNLSALGQSSRPTFRAYSVLDLAVSANTETQITFEAKGWDFGRLDEEGQQTGSFDVDVDEMRAQLTGVYGLHFNTTLEATTSHRVELRIYVNGSLFVTDHRQTQANDLQTASFARELYLERGDMVELRAFSVGNPVTIKADRDWTGRLVNR